MFGRRREPNLAVDLLVGAASGIFASWVMEKAQSRISKMGSSQARAAEKAAAGPEPATYKAAAMAVKPFGIRLTRQQKGMGGQIVHFAYGAAWGAVFAAATRRSRLPIPFNGALFGIGLWFLSDEVLVPLVGLSKNPTAYPPSTHLKALAAHLVYGTTTARAHHLLQNFT